STRPTCSSSTCSPAMRTARRCWSRGSTISARAPRAPRCRTCGSCWGSSSMPARAKVAVLGASGYTGADAVRLLARHPDVEIAALTANTHAGKQMDEVFPHFFMLDLPRLTEWEKVD